MAPIESITSVIADHLRIAAPVVAFLASYVLYGVIGKRFLGADDDYWPALRRRVLPVLHRLGMTSDLYAVRQQDRSEFVGIVKIDVDVLERELEDMGYYRNPLAALKRSPHGWKSDGSWARRYGRVRWLGDVLRGFSYPGGYPLRLLGRAFQAGGDVLATRQVHVTLYVEERGNETYVWLYAHDEPSSLNPLTAWQHYVGRGQSHERGVRKVRNDLRDEHIEFRVPE